MQKLLTHFLIILGITLSIHLSAEDPLRGGDLKTHLSGPKVKSGSLEGKVVLLEYWGYN